MMTRRVGRIAEPPTFRPVTESCRKIQFASATFVSSVDLAMKLTRERKIVGAVLVVALGFLGYDQLSGAGNSIDEAQADASSLLLASGTHSTNNSARTSDTSND